MPDIGADTMYENATEKGTIDTLPEFRGLLFGTAVTSESISEAVK